MKISVIIPVFNRPKLVLRAIESVLNQTFKADEIIVIDDGSIDHTLEVLRELKTIKLISQKNRGVSSARNIGIKKSLNHWVAFLDSDDMWSKEKLAVQVDFHKNNDEILISHTCEEWIRNGKIVRQKKQHQKPEGFCFNENLNFCKIAPSTVMIKKIVFDKVGYFDESLKICEDYDLWLRVLRGYKLGLINKVLTTKYAGHEQLSARYNLMDIQRVKALLKHKELSIARDEIVKKIEILQNGALRHKNNEVLSFCEKVREKL